MHINYGNLNEKWRELRTQMKEPTAWNDFLETKGLMTKLSVERKLGKSGLLDLIDGLINIINNDEDKVVVVEDPSADGTDFYSYLVFKRDLIDDLFEIIDNKELSS